jgi:hypothetical protein
MLQITRRGTALAGMFVLHDMLSAPSGFGRPQTADGLKVRVQSLHKKGGRVTVTTAYKTTVRGNIIRVDEDSFAVREEKSTRETVIPFARLTNIKAGSSGHKKTILIPAAIVGGAVLVLCAAPYPIGFLCHKDPS